MTLGYAAIFITILLWSGFFLSLKGGAISSLQSDDIALARFLLPALVLLPSVLRHIGKVRSIPNKYLLGIVIGCGLPYLLVASSAMQYVPVSHGSALIPGTLPLFVSTIAVICYQQPLSRHRMIGLLSVLFGIATFLISNANSHYDEGQFQGHLLLLLGCFMWAVFTISARVANLGAYVTAGFTAIISLIILVVAVGLGWLESHLVKVPISQWPWQEMMNHIMLQGLGAGIIASFTFLYAVRTIGAEASAAFGSLTPVVATLLAIPIFDEHPDTITWCALILVTCGSIVASNVFMKQDLSQTYRPPVHK